MSILHRTPIFVLVAAIVLGVIVVSWLDNFTLRRHQSADVSFESGGHRLEGTIALPKGEGPFPIVVIVHGDGPATRFLDGGLLPFVNALLDAGLGVFAWDKPGTGNSDGDWLAQSMADRAAEASAAFKFISENEDVKSSAVGFVGFSQASWAVPQAAQAVDPAFVVIIGGAMNWRDQAAYFTQQRLMAEGVFAQEALSLALSQQAIEDQALRGAQVDPRPFPGMDPRRLAFVHRNYLADSTTALSRLRSPILAIWGAKDRNTDPLRNVSRFRDALPATTHARFEIVPSATHSLLDADLFDYQTPGAWPWYAQWAYVLLGREAYAQGALDIVTGWITKTVDPLAPS